MIEFFHVLAACLALSTLWWGVAALLDYRAERRRRLYRERLNKEFEEMLEQAFRR